VKKLNINAIRIDGGTQSRVEINNEVVSDYAEAVKVGIEFPPIVVFHDGADHWLADGFHRYHAHKQAGKASIPAEIRDGTVRDAILFSLGANCTHGLRRTNADKRKAVQTLLADPEWAAWSDRKIADACGVGHPFVAALRRPEVAAKQQENRAASASKKVEKVESDSTSRASATIPKVESDSTRKGRDVPAAAAAPADSVDLAEAQHTIAELAQENEQLRDKLAVESLMDSEEAKTQTAETIRELRALVNTLQAENAALKVSRDTYQREAAEAKKSAIYWRKQAEKAAKDAA
jgi:hypothetical protein